MPGSVRRCPRGKSIISAWIAVSTSRCGCANERVAQSKGPCMPKLRALEAEARAAADLALLPARWREIAPAEARGEALECV